MAKPNPHNWFKPALLIAACAAVGLAFSARAQQKPGDDGTGDDQITAADLRVDAVPQSSVEVATPGQQYQDGQQRHPGLTDDLSGQKR